jgi:radical SAM superfamily enzyme YgiQ (UPF0313 family)
MKSTSSNNGRRILLVHPGGPRRDLFDRLGRSDSPPLGVLYLASSLEAAGHEVRVVDLNLPHHEDSINPLLQNWRPHIVGLGTLAPSFQDVMDRARCIRKQLPDDVLLIAGGADATARTDLYTQGDIFDAVLFGEAEKSIVRLADSHPTIPEGEGIIPRGKSARSTPEPLDPDSLPFPARHLLPLKRYRGGPAYKRRRYSTSIFTHRGCAYNCSFCEKSVHHGAMRFRSAASIHEEIRRIRSDYGIHDIRFVDDVLMINKRILGELIDLIRHEADPFDWMCCGRIDLMDEKMLAEMKKAGCYRIEIGIESGSARVLDLVKKGTAPGQALEAMRKARVAGIEVIANFIIGFPTETGEEMARTVDLSLKTDPDYAVYFLFTPFSDAPISKDFNLGWDDSAPGFRAHSPAYLVPSDQAQDMVDSALRRFYFRPGYILRRLVAIRNPWIIADLALCAGLFLYRRIKNIICS